MRTRDFHGAQPCAEGFSKQIIQEGVTLVKVIELSDRLFENA